MPGLPKYIPQQLALAYAEQMKRPDLVFMTEANKEEITREMAERRATCPHDWEEITTPAVGKNPEVVHTVCKICMVDKKQWDEAIAATKGGN